MRRQPLGSFAYALLAMSLVTSEAGSTAEANPDAVVVRAGSSTMTSSQLGEAFARLRPFQRQKYGRTVGAQLRGYVEQVVTRDLLLAERGKRSGLLDSSRVKARHHVVLGETLVESLGKRVERENPVTDTDVKNYYDAHPELFKTPARIRIQRLLVDTKEEAIELIDRVKQLPNMDEWRNLVREKSRDKATSERGGELGFVAADGTTDVPELEVNRALFEAAQTVRDGEVVPKPVAEGTRFAIVWRRGSVAEKVLDLKQESPRIREQLLNARVDQELNELILRLRREHLRDYHPQQVTDREFP